MTGIYPLRKRLSKIGLLQGYVLSFRGSDGGPHGDRWSIYVTWPQTRWVETDVEELGYSEYYEQSASRSDVVTDHSPLLVRAQ